MKKIFEFIIRRKFVITYKYKNFRIRLWVIRNRKLCVSGSMTGIRWIFRSINVNMAVYKLDLRIINKLVVVAAFTYLEDWVK